MPLSLRFLVIASTLVLFNVAGAQQADTPVMPVVGQYARLGGIAVSSEVPPEQYQVLAQDWAQISRLQFSQPDPALLSMMHISDGSTSSLLGWLQERVHVLVSEKFSETESENRFPLQTGVAFPAEATPIYQDEWQPIEEPPPLPPNPSGNPAPPRRFYTVMSNIGATIYDNGFNLKEIFGLLVPGVGVVPVDTPRAGILKIGEGLFAKDISFLKALPLESFARQVFRWSTFFHEARHSDGNGATRGFFHSVCTKGDFAGQYACDRNLNGPYALEAAFQRSFLKDCASCTVQDQEVIKVMALDSASRVIRLTMTTSEKIAKDRSEAFHWQNVQKCQDAIQAHIALPDICGDLKSEQMKLQALINETDPGMGTFSTNWDDRPEKVVTP